MALEAHKPADAGNQPIPLALFASPQSYAAWRVYNALVRLSIDDKELGRIPMMAEFRRIAFGRIKFDVFGGEA